MIGEIKGDGTLTQARKNLNKVIGHPNYNRWMRVDFCMLPGSRLFRGAQEFQVGSSKQELTR